MKRKLLGLICACMLFSGCGIGSSSPLQTQSAPTQSPTTPDLPLLEQGTALEESSNLLHIPTPALDGMVSPEIHLFGNGLLFSEHMGNELVLKHISLENGALVAESSVPAGSDTKLAIGNGKIGLCDRGSGSIAILDAEFRLQKSYDVPREGDAWYLNSELDTLYIFYSDQGLLARNLETGEVRWLVENGFRVACKGTGSSYIIFEYTDRADQKNYTRCLNLSMATLETLPMEGTITGGTRNGETWLLQSGEKYILVQGDELCSVALEGAAVRLLSPRRHLLVMDASCRNLSIYETDGTFLSQCALPQNSNAAVGSDFIWSGYWEGYFFTDFIDSSCRLMFWDVDANTEGENLQLSPFGEAQQSQTLVEPQLYERAAQLSKQFGVDIRIAEQCSLDYSHYDTYVLTDPVFIRSALDVLEETLRQYPEGFFHQLPYGSIESIRIELVGGLTAKPGVDTHPLSIGAFAQDRGSYYTMVLDGFLIQPQTLYHEFSHIIEARLEWDSGIREDAFYSEETWLALQPEGFQYAMTYTEIPEELLQFIDSGYFITDYSMTFPTEDRAVLLASAMENNSWDFEPGTGRREKLRYYADCIRDCFNTDAWPETTLWEQVLK